MRRAPKVMRHCRQRHLRNDIRAAARLDQPFSGIAGLPPARVHGHRLFVAVFMPERGSGRVLRLRADYPHYGFWRSVVRGVVDAADSPSAAQLGDTGRADASYQQHRWSNALQ